MDQPATLVGIHIRRHTPRQRRRGKRPSSRLVVQLVALHATTDATTPWPAEMYSDQHGKWMPYADALASCHAGEIGSTEHGRDTDRAALVRDYVEQALAQLHDTGLVIVFTDAAPSTRPSWTRSASRWRLRTGTPGGAR